MRSENCPTATSPVISPHMKKCGKNRADAVYLRCQFEKLTVHWVLPVELGSQQKETKWETEDLLLSALQRCWKQAQKAGSTGHPLKSLALQVYRKKKAIQLLQFFQILREEAWSQIVIFIEGESCNFHQLDGHVFYMAPRSLTSGRKKKSLLQFPAPENQYFFPL